MKHIFFTILIAVTLLSGCFRDEAEIRLTLTSTGSAETLHIAVLENETVLEEKSFQESDGKASFSIPSNKDVTFVVIGTNSSDEVIISGMKNVKTGSDTFQNITIDMLATTWANTGAQYSMSHDDAFGILYWEDIGYTNIKYIVEGPGGSIIYEGTGTEIDSIAGDHYLYVEFYPFKLRTAGNYYNVIIV